MSKKKRKAPIDNKKMMSDHYFFLENMEVIKEYQRRQSNIVGNATRSGYLQAILTASKIVRDHGKNGQCQAPHCYEQLSNQILDLLK